MSQDKNKIAVLRAEQERLSNYAAMYADRLESAKKDKSALDKLRVISAQQTDLQERVGFMCTALKELSKLAHNEEIDYKKSRLNHLDSKITIGLGKLFPSKHLTAKTECNFSRSNLKLQLRLRDGAGWVRPPFLTEGKFSQQLISFLAAFCACELLGANKLFLDEAFSNSSEENLVKMQEILRPLLDSGIQVFMISQSPLLFNDLPRRVIELEANYLGYVEDSRTTDFS